ncbi:MAG: CDP-alcohol phosphatidyltransferase family protein [Cellulosilyticaceae bacterium]
MLDTNARKYVQPIITKTAEILLKKNITPNQVTVFAFLLGISTSIWIVLGQPIIGLIFLWISGFFDAVDGSMARIGKMQSPWGSLMDIVFDRLVELSMVIAIGIMQPQSRLALIVLVSTIVFSMCVFLTVGALAENNGIKSFRYQAGLMERTEGFIGFSIMILFMQQAHYITCIMALLIGFTALQRMMEAYKIFSKIK